MSAERNAEKALTASKASHDFEPPQALVEFMTTGWIDRPVAEETHPQAERFRARRDDLSRAYPGTYVVVPAGRERVRANDTSFRFRPSSDFAYLTGGDEPGAVLILEPDGARHRSVLFVPAHNRGQAEFFTDRVYGELWVGRHRGVDESRAFFGVDDCRPLQALPEHLRELRDSKYSLRLLRTHDDEIDGAFEKTDGDAELAELLSETRLIKDDYELDELRKACAITKRAFEDAIRAMRSAKSEREIEAAFWGRSRIEGNDVGYLTIAAASDHACTLHWTKNDGALRPGDLLLLDAGAECHSLYTADVTRTLPVSGRFSAEQQAVYDVVWEAQRAGIEAVAPGNDFLEPSRRAVRVLAQGLIDFGSPEGLARGGGGPRSSASPALLAARRQPHAGARRARLRRAREAPNTVTASSARAWSLPSNRVSISSPTIRPCPNASAGSAYESKTTSPLPAPASRIFPPRFHHVAATSNAGSRRSGKADR